MSESFAVGESPLRECWARRSRTGVEGWSWRAAVAFELLTAGAAVALFTLGMPRFSARLVAMDDWGSLRRDVGGVVEEAAGVCGTAVVEDLGREETDESVGCFVAAAVFFCLGGASLIRPASLRWCTSSRARMRRAWGSSQRGVLARMMRW